MAVYTHLSSSEIAEILSAYDVGSLRSANSNWLVETVQDNAARHFILTVFEARTEAEELPFFLSLLDHLSARGQPVPRTIHTRDDARMITIRGKQAALFAAAVDLYRNAARPCGPVRRD